MNDTMHTRSHRQRLPILITIGLIAIAGLILGALHLGLLPGVIAWANERAARTATLYTPSPIPPTAEPTAVGEVTPSPTPSPTPTVTPSPTPPPTTPPDTATPEQPESGHALSPLNTPTPTPPGATAEPGSTPTLVPGRVWPSPDPAQAQDHYWLERPIGPGGQIYANAWYPYGTDARGQYLPHHGADIVNEEGTPVLAVAEAEVVIAGTDAEQVVGPEPNFYGNLIVLRLLRTYHDQPVFVLYGHLSEVDVQPGEIVQPGQPIGRVGMTGIALGPHLHIEVRVGQNDYAHTRNPELWLKPSPGYGTLAGRLVNAEGRTWANVPILIYQAPNFDRIWQQVYTYLDLPDIHPDDDWGENFMLADMPVGQYRIETQINGHLYQRDVEIQDGQTTFVVIQTTD